MKSNIVVILLWIALTGALALLVLVLAVTAEVRHSNENTIQKLEQDKIQLNKELEAKRETKPVAKTKEVSKPAPVNVAVPVGKDALVAAVYATFGKDSRLLTLVNCESGWNTQATGYDGAPYYQYNYGLFQVASTHGYSASYLYNPYNNIKVAKQIYLAQGWGAWPTCSRVAGFI